MRNFPGNGVDVRLSELTQRSYRAAPCELLVQVTRKNRAKALQAFARKQNEFSGLHLSGIVDLSFLADFEDLRYLEIVDQDKVDLRPLAALSNLRGLRVQTPGCGLDFSWFPELEVFVGDWHSDNVNVPAANELRRLHVWHFKPKSQDLSELARATRLEWLGLTQTGIASLAGLELLPDLRYLDIAHAAKLESLEALAEEAIELRELSFERVKKIRSYAPIGQMPRLRRLKLSDCAPMPTLIWTRGLGQLDFLSFVGTNVEDGDLSPLLELPQLRYAGFMNKKHYSLKFADINRLLEKRASGGMTSRP